MKFKRMQTTFNIGTFENDRKFITQILLYAFGLAFAFHGGREMYRNRQTLLERFGWRTFIIIDWD